MKGIVPILYFIYSNRIYIIYFERRKVREWFQKYKYTELDFFVLRLLLRLEYVKEVCGEYPKQHSFSCLTHPKGRVILSHRHLRHLQPTRPLHALCHRQELELCNDPSRMLFPCVDFFPNTVRLFSS